MASTIGVGLVGYKFMGRAHSNAYRQVAPFFPDVALRPALKAICGRDELAVREAAAQFGWEGYETDWRKLVARDDIGLVDVSTPATAMPTIAIGAAEHGKHVSARSRLRIRWPRRSRCSRQFRKPASSTWSTLITGVYRRCSSPNS